jgi:hemerythrin-like domain-containing protein
MASSTTSTPNTLGFRIAHRTMRGEARRLAREVTEIAAGRRPCDPARARAVNGFVLPLCDTVHHHHSVEDEALWPVIRRAAGADADLSDLTDDHAQLDPVLERVRAAAAAFTGPAATAGPLAAELTTLADLLDEHIEEEERIIFPLIERYVTPDQWKAVEKQAREGGNIRHDLPRIERYARPEELAELRRLAGPVLMLLLAFLRPGYRRRERLVFQSAVLP